MKRYRIMTHDFDARASSSALEIRDEWDEEIKRLHHENKAQTRQGILYQYGQEAAETKLQNVMDLGAKPFSVLAFHNRFAEQIRHSFVVGSYYPALVGACALGERLLNHLILNLREDIRGMPEYKKVYRKSSFDDWELAIGILEAWDVLLPQASHAFRELAKIRNRRAIHFNPAIDRDDRPLALEAIRHLNEVVYYQFGSFGPQPWLFIYEGECYVKKEAESDPFVRKIYLPNSWLVGPQHFLELVEGGFVLRDDHEYEDREISDEEFRTLRKRGRQAYFEALRASEKS